MIKGTKIYLKSVSSNDTDLMVELLNDQETAFFEGKQEFLVNTNDQRRWFENKSSKQMNLVVYSFENERIGYVSFKFTNEVARIGHIGIKLHKDFRGKGYAGDALKTLCAYLFMNFNVHKLKTHIVEYNESSLALFDKNLWVREGVARQEVYMNGRYHNNIQLGLLKQEFIDNKSNDIYMNNLNFTRT